jgi:hypothetical protein
MARKTVSRCAACGTTDPLGGSMSRVVVDGASLCLCRAHAAMVASALPSTFEDLRAVFRGLETPLLAGRGPGQVERRSPIARRAELDRREFPPRPEGRRTSGGRRSGDAAA